jgi:hypothetical protein
LVDSQLLKKKSPPAKLVRFSATIDFTTQTPPRRISVKTKKTYEVIAHDLRDIDPLRFAFSKPAEAFAHLIPKVRVEASQIFTPRVDVQTPG